MKQETRSWPEREKAGGGLGVLRKGAEMGKEGPKPGILPRAESVEMLLLVRG